MTAITPFPFGITVTVQRPVEGAITRHGDTVYADHHDIEGCAMAPRYSNEDNTNRTSVITGFSLFGPPGSDILAIDRVRTPDGNIYRVVGEAAHWGPHPMTGWAPGFEAALERVT